MPRQLIGVALLVAFAIGQRASVDEAFEAFWAAGSPDAAARLVDDVVRSGVTFDDAYRRLRQGRTYSAQKTGMVRLTIRASLSGNEVEHDFGLNFGVRSIAARINRVIAGSNAERMDLRPGDVLVRLNDETVRVSVDVADALADVKVGSEITRLVARNNAPVELTGRYDPQMVTLPPRQVFDHSLPSGRVDLGIRD